MTQGNRVAAGMLAASLLFGLGAACTPVQLDVTPPSLMLDETYIPSTLPRGDYRLTNGEGEVLMEVNRLRPEQEHTATFPLDKLDGTINIVAFKDGKEIYSQTVTHTPGKRIQLHWDIPAERFLVIEDPEPPRSRSSARDGGGDGKD
jgi:hypothetical protein